MSNEKRETGRKDDRPMVKVKKGNPASPLLILRWPLLALANFLLVLAFQALFIHTHPAPLTPDRLEALPYFSNCDVRSIAGAMPTQAGLMRGQSDPSWVLYRNSAGETHAVRIEWNLLLPRYKIEKGTDTRTMWRYTPLPSGISWGKARSRSPAGASFPALEAPACSASKGT